MYGKKTTGMHNDRELFRRIIVQFTYSRQVSHDVHLLLDKIQILYYLYCVSKLQICCLNIVSIKCHFNFLPILFKIDFQVLCNWTSSRLSYCRSYDKIPSMSLFALDFGLCPLISYNFQRQQSPYHYQ